MLRSTPAVPPHPATRAVRMGLPAAIAVLAVLGTALASPPRPAAGQGAGDLLAGVRRVAAPGVPGPLCVYGGADAAPVVVGGAGGDTRLPVVAAAPLGRGRVVAFGHGGYLDRATLDTADTGRLLRNAVAWAAGGRARPRVGVVGAAGAAGYLRAHGFAVDEVGVGALAGHDAVVVGPWAEPDADVARLQAFVSAGGGLVAAATGWGWAQLNPDRDLRRDFAGNRLLAPAGIQWANDWLGETDPAGGYAVDGPPSTLTAADGALRAALAHEAGTAGRSPAELAQISRTLVANAVCAPPGDTLLVPRLRAAVPDVVVPSREDPVMADEVLDRVAVTLQTRDFDALPLEQARAHPAAARFPGAVAPEAARVTRAVTVTASAAGWRSTGLYAPPGEVITVRLPPAAATGRLGLQVGSHSDTLWGVTDGWRRMPDIVRRWPLDAAETRVFSPYGGLVYLVPSGGPAGGTGADVRVEIAGAVEAPYFALGETDPAAWRARLQASGAPWAEVAGRSMVVTTPAAHVRGLADPTDVARTWDDVLLHAAILARRAAPGERARPERFVADEQISAGYMHAGYPLMCHLDQAANLVSAANLREGNWGFFHEVGHNHQSPDWTFEGTGEVTVNLFTLFVYEHVSGVPVKDNARGSEAFVREQLAKVDWAAPDFERWKADPFLALAMYVQIQHAFGWEAYLRVFDAYAGLGAAERPRTDDDKRDQWLVRFSRAVGRDLGPFFEAWGVPTSAAARAAVAGLPVWMPEGFPPGYAPVPTATSTPPPPPTSPPTSTATPTRTPGAPTDPAAPPAAHGAYLPLAWRP